MQTRTPQVTGNGTAPGGGARIVLTAPLTETIDHAGYFIQMSMASLPMWLEGILNKKNPKRREVGYKNDGPTRHTSAAAHRARPRAGGRCRDRVDRYAYRDHRPRRLLHPDEHGRAADVARRQPQQDVPELA